MIVAENQVIETLPPDACDRLLDWCKEQPMEAELFNGILTRRLMAWYGIGVRFRKGEWGAQVCTRFLAQKTIEEEALLAQLRNRYYPQANSCLFYRYPVGAGIGEHRDKGFDQTVVAVNLLDCDRNLFGTKHEVAKFIWGGNEVLLGDGDVMLFDSWVKHSLKPVKCDRYSLQFRRAV